MSEANTEADLSDESQTSITSKKRKHQGVTITEATPSINYTPSIPSILHSPTELDKKRKVCFDPSLCTRSASVSEQYPESDSTQSVGPSRDDSSCPNSESKKRRKQTTPIRVANLFDLEAGTKLKHDLGRSLEVRNGNKASTPIELDTGRISECDESRVDETCEDYYTFSNKENRQIFDMSNWKRSSEDKLASTRDLEDDPYKHSFGSEQFQTEIKPEPIDESYDKSDTRTTEATSQVSGVREDWFPMLPFNFFPENNFLGQKSSFIQKNGFISDRNFLNFLPNLPSNPPVRIFNPEAYCNLCHKEFCNKYFLKTHKANKHGIYENLSTSQDGSLMFNSPKIQKIDGIVPQEQNVNLIMNQLFKTKSLGSERLQGDESVFLGASTIAENNDQILKSTDVTCDICYKKCPNVFFLRKHKIDDHGLEQGVLNLEESTASLDSKQLSTARGVCTEINILSPLLNDDLSDGKDIQYPRKLSPDACQVARNSDFAVEKLKHLGVLNPEAFCKLCCKEYCNKYFLRTHNQKRHPTILQGLTASKLEECKESQNQAQTSPLNLIVDDRQKVPHGDGGEDSDDHSVYVDQISAPREHSQNGQDEPLEKENRKSIDVPSVDGYELSSKISDNVERVSPRSDISSKSQDLCKDLQKLQSMILQLNNLQSKKTQLCCTLCGKQMSDEVNFQMHMASHSLPYDKNENKNKSNNLNGCSDMEDILINQTITDKNKHIMQRENILNNLYDDTKKGEIYSHSYEEMHKTPEKQIIGTMPNPNNIQKNFNITNSFCEICNKQLCNKYFMKTHMEKMHGIQINNEFKIGGVICDICQKELCSKYFLKVHKQNTHGIFEEGSGQGSSLFPQNVGLHQNLGAFPQGSLIIRHNGDAENLLSSSLQEPSNSMIKSEATTVLIPDLLDAKQTNSIMDLSKPMLELNHNIPHELGQSLKRNDSASLSSQSLMEHVPSSKPNLIDFSQRYFTHFNEVCQICNRRFRSTKWLRAHLLNDHGGNPDSISKGDDAGINSECSAGNTNTPENYEKSSLKIPNDSLLNISLPMVSNIFDGNSWKTYKCNYCNFSSHILALLFVHERSHSNANRLLPHPLHDHVSSQTVGSEPTSPTDLSAVLSHKVNVSLEKTIQLQESCGKYNMVSSYALPDNKKTTANYSMQAFVLEENSAVVKATQCVNQEGHDDPNPVSESSPKVYGNGEIHDENISPTKSSGKDKKSDIDQVDEDGTHKGNYNIVPAVIYLPVIEKLHKKTNVTFTLTPI